MWVALDNNEAVKFVRALLSREEEADEPGDRNKNRPSQISKHLSRLSNNRRRSSLFASQTFLNVSEPEI